MKFPYIVQTQCPWTTNDQYMEKLNEVRAWLTEQVGEPYNDWVTALGDEDCLQIRFARESDAAWFALKWG